MFDPAAVAAFREHAIEGYPEEVVGAITPDGYQRLENVATDPSGAVEPQEWRRRHFDAGTVVLELIAAGRLLALLHSHPDGPEWPSMHDQRQQIAMDLPWGICACSAEATTEPYFWGDCFDPPPLLGRVFRTGPSGTDGRGDCGALVRDWYRLERGILLPDCPRDDVWFQNGGDLYTLHYPRAGFVAVPIEEAAAGDVVLMQIRAPVPNHAGIFLGDGTLMHHLEGRLSRIEPVGPWRKHIVRWMRHAPA